MEKQRFFQKYDTLFQSLKQSAESYVSADSLGQYVKHELCLYIHLHLKSFIFNIKGSKMVIKYNFHDVLFYFFIKVYPNIKLPEGCSIQL